MVELLVVIAILAALSGVGFTVMTGLRKTSGGLKCMSGLREWSQVFQLHATDNHGFYEVSRKWAPIATDPDKESPYVKYWDENDIWLARAKHLEMRRCPTLTEGLTPSGNPSPTYLMNRVLANDPTGRLAKPDSIESPSRRLLFVDGNAGHAGEITSSSEGIISNYIESIADLHGGKVNVVFADLRIQSMSPNELKKRWKVMIDGPPAGRGGR